MVDFFIRLTISELGTRIFLYIWNAADVGNAWARTLSSFENFLFFQKLAEEIFFFEDLFFDYLRFEYTIVHSSYTLHTHTSRKLFAIDSLIKGKGI